MRLHRFPRDKKKILPNNSTLDALLTFQRLGPAISPQPICLWFPSSSRRTSQVDRSHHQHNTAKEGIQFDDRFLNEPQ